MDVCPAFCVGVPLPYFRFKPVIIVREKKRTVSQANVLCAFIMGLLYQTILFPSYYDKLTLVKSKKNLYFGKGVSHGAGLYDIMLLYISVFL